MMGRVQCKAPTRKRMPDDDFMQDPALITKPCFSAKKVNAPLANCGSSTSDKSSPATLTQGQNFAQSIPASLATDSPEAAPSPVVMTSLPPPQHSNVRPSPANAVNISRAC